MPRNEGEKHMTQEITIEENPEISLLLGEIAKRYLGLPTLDTRNSDTQDFHDLAVWSIKAALAAAFEAGTKAKPDDGRLYPPAASF